MSLPLKSLSSAPSFVVNGKSLQLHLPRPLTPLPTRKIYNPTYFFNESYQHEIANHYRDYKRRSRMSRLSRRRRHTRTLYVPYRRAAFYGVVSGEQRTVLPIAVHDFPRFTAVYTTPRGRQTLCEDEPPDDTYNATVRRIRQANTHKELKTLVDRQLRLSGSTHYNKKSIRKREGEELRSGKTAKWAEEVERGVCETNTDQTKRINNGADVKACEKWYGCPDNADDYNNDDDDYYDATNANDRVRKVKASEVRLTAYSKQQKDKQKFNELELKPKQTPNQTGKRPTPDFRLELSTSGRKVNPQSAKQRNKNKLQSSKPKKKAAEALQPSTLQDFLSLACEYYEQGYLRNINYLQAIGARNSACRNQRKLVAQATPQATSNSSNDESVTVTASATTSATNTPSPTPRRVGDYFRLTRLLRRIGRKRSFKVDPSNYSRSAQSKATAKLEQEERVHVKPLAIRVNITPYVAQASKAERNKTDRRQCAATATPHSTAAQLSKPASRVSQLPPVVKCHTHASHAHSMNIYLNANLPTAISTTNIITQQQQASTAKTAEATATNRAHFHDLIDHLMQLELNDIDASSLPKITLTDCSSINNGALAEVETTTTTTLQANANAFAFEFDTNFTSNSSFSAHNALETQEDQLQQQQKLPASSHRNGFTLRAAKFGVLNSSLDIPDELCYNSEARPP